MEIGWIVAAVAAGIITALAVIAESLSQQLVRMDEGHFDVFGDEHVGK